MNVNHTLKALKFYLKALVDRLRNCIDKTHIFLHSFETFDSFSLANKKRTDIKQI